MIPSQVQYYVIQYKPKAATWDYKEISGAITNFYDIRGLRWVEVDILRGNNIDSGQLWNFCFEFPPEEGVYQWFSISNI